MQIQTVNNLFKLTLTISSILIFSFLLNLSLTVLKFIHIGGKCQNNKMKKMGMSINYMAEKAGMAEVDKQKIAEIIQKLTEGSPKSIYEKQMNQKRQLQLAEMLTKILEFSTEQKREMKQQWQPQIERIKQNRNLNKYWAHLDFDMFYVACQMLGRPELKDKPCAVGGQFSVVCTANYVARKYGVRSALPTFIAKKLCPQIILITPDFIKYKKFSNIFRDVLRKFDPEMQSMGLDQAYVQLTDSMKDKSLEEQEIFINSIRQEIFQKTGLTVSCGVGANKLLSKLASEQRKPNGQFILPNNPDMILDYMKPKRIRKVPGIGPVNEFFLKGLGIQTAGDILQNTDVLSICFSSNSAQFYISTALGIGSTQHQFSQRKSLGKSQTFKATNEIGYLFEKMYEICQQVSMQLQQLGYVSKNVVFSYQNQMYAKKDKTFQLNKYTSAKQDLVEQILPYLKNYIQTKQQKIRLLGARCTSIIRIQDLRKLQLDKYLLKPGNDSQLTGCLQGNNMNKRQSSGVMSYFCPICNDEIDCKGNLASFNRHIDKCMTGEFQQGKKQTKADLSTKQKAEKQVSLMQIQSKSTYKAGQKQKKERMQKKNSQKGSIFNFLKKKE